MVCETFSQGGSAIHRLDPRGRVIVAVAFSLIVAVVSRFSALGVGLALSLAAAVAARLPVMPTLKRMAGVNAFLVLLWVVLPLTTPGAAVFHVEPLSFSAAGATMAGLITLKANAIVLMFTALISTLELTTLGHAMGHLRLPHKLTHLFLFTVRYIDVLHHEYDRLRQAMKVRGFRPGVNVHTCRTIGHLVGMLLVKSLDRSERVFAAMKCRGFQGRFYMLDHFALASRDVVFGALSLAALMALAWMAWA